MKIEQKIKAGEETICSTCIHKEVCRAIENQPCIECSKYEENGVWIENNKEKLIELLESAESAIYWSSDDRSFIEKIADHLISHRVVVLPKDTQDIRWSRIIELLIADSEGRVVILPTKEEVPAKDINVPSKEENR